MKTFILNLARNILHYLYINRKEIVTLYKKYKKDPRTKIDGKLTLKELEVGFELYKNSGLKVTREDLQIPVGGEESYKVPQNIHKNLVEYLQIGPTCAIYAMGRSIMYNTGLVFTQEEHEQVAQLARDKGWLTSSGMTFIESGRTWTEWMANKGYELKIERTPYGGSVYNEFKNKEYSCLIGGYITERYLLDKEADGIIDDRYTWTESKLYGHAWTEESRGSMTDNYKDSPYVKVNRYINTKATDFIRNTYYFSWAYFCYIENPGEKSDYEKFLERGYIENPNPTRNIDEKLFGTLMERILRDFK